MDAIGMVFEEETGDPNDIPIRRSTYRDSLAVAEEGRSEASSRSTAHRTADGGIVLNFPQGGSAGIRLAADVDELERERLMALMDVRHMTWRHRWFSILEGRPHEFDETLALVFNIVSFTVVLISCIVFAIASVPTVISPEATLDDQVQHGTFWVEALCILYFIFEALLRIASVPLHMLVTPLFVVDVATIIGFFTDFFANSEVSFLRVLRLLRVFRVMKVSRYSRTLQLVFKVFAQSASGLSVLLMPIFLVVITAATILYFVEISDAVFNVEIRRWVMDGRPAAFQSVFDGVWFTMATITTIGYGDIVPQTLGGKLIAALLSLFGVLTLSFPNLVLGANLESAFALHKRAAARTFFAKRFRKIWIMMSFIRRARVMAETARLKQQAYESQIRTLQMAAKNKNKDGKRRNNNLNSSTGGGSSPETDILASSFVKDANGNIVVTASNLKDAEELEDFGYHTLPRHYRLFPQDDEEPSDTAIGGVTSERGRPLFFDITVNQCASLVQPLANAATNIKENGEITDENVRLWNYKGLKVLKLLQALLEGWSGIGTPQEIFDALPHKPDELTVNDVAVACMFLGAAQLLNIFVLRRASIQFVCSLTYSSTTELSLGKEDGRIECRRSAEFARFIWKQTTGRVAPFNHHMLTKNYAMWASKEKYAGMGTADTSPDLKLHVGVTPGELKELRRILATRTTDLSSVIPDIDRFHEQAEERMMLPEASGGDALFSSTHASFRLSKEERAEKNIIGHDPNDKPDETHRKTVKLMLLYQRSLADSLGIKLEPK